MYDLKSVSDGTALSKDAILDRTSEAEIMRHYIGFDFTTNRAFKSPLRDDERPSFAVYYNESKELRFKDFNGAQGTCFDLVMVLYNLSFIEAMARVNQDLCLGLAGYVGNVNDAPIRYNNFKLDIEKKKNLIQFKPQVFTDIDIKYWRQYCITDRMLEMFNVYSAKYVYLNKKPILFYSRAEPMYCYKFNEEQVKIYRPKSKRIKWMGNVTSEDLQGLEQLSTAVKNFGDKTLIITKSLKDVMCLYALGIPAVAPQSENTRTQYEILAKLVPHFDTVKILFDNDEAGKKGAQELQSYFGNNNITSKRMSWVEPIFIPGEHKDISDLICAEGFESGLKFLKNEQLE
tara:strand:+ start:6143 stop:7177 length:1035 start_codon:yes stop_codon:yes gene_type:complete